MAIIGSLTDPCHVQTNRVNVGDDLTVTLECWKRNDNGGHTSAERQSLPVLPDEVEHDRAVTAAANDMIRRHSSTP